MGARMHTHTQHIRIKEDVTTTLQARTEQEEEEEEEGDNNSYFNV